MHMHHIGLSLTRQNRVAAAAQAAATSRDGTLRSGLMRAYVCVSPALANELCACAHVRHPCMRPT